MNVTERISTTLTMTTATTTALSTITEMLTLQETKDVMDGSPNVSPVTLSSEWSRVIRLLTLTSLAVIGSVGNVFMISAIMVEDHLKKIGNALLANVALADLLISGLVIPTSTILILAGMDEDYPQGMCSFEWTLEALCFLVTLLTIGAIAVENYLRLCWPVDR
ncbi:hypothetical protein QAD02_006270 [Eretmocerus hayati]|uniref:Uncharacterized protein n=1 Tax=Eretmocerus hayati TaxID=131215 RepID=A0ACC2N1I5_9HYME|nr:hypothetical protein QAD02_006270 [Eretmocerus hayati]